MNRLSLHVALIGLVVCIPAMGVATDWEKLVQRFGTELLRDQCNKASQAIIDESTLEVCDFTIGNAGDIAEYIIAGLTSSPDKRSHEIITRLATNSAYYIIAPILKHIINNNENWQKCELLVRTLTKFIANNVIRKNYP